MQVGDLYKNLALQPEKENISVKGANPDHSRSFNKENKNSQLLRNLLDYGLKDLGNQFIEEI